MNAETNDFETNATPNEGDRLHRLLCATVLGEASADERAEVERALETSPELRAERARLEATIGLVQGSLLDGERLSPAAERELEHALARRRPRPWHSRPAFRIAASVLAIGSIGWVALRVFEARRDARNEDVAPREEPPARDDEVARLDESERGQLRSIGYSDGSTASPAPKSEASPSDARTALAKQRQAGERAELDAGRTVQVPGVTVDLLARRLPAESPRPESSVFGVEASQPATDSLVLKELARPAEDRSVASIDETSSAEESSRTFASHGAESKTGVSLGLGAKPGSAQRDRSTTPAAGSAGTGGAYRGASDTVPPGPGAIATEQEKALSALGYYVGGDAARENAPASGEAKQVTQRLRALGYTEDGRIVVWEVDTEEKRKDDASERGGQVTFEGNEFVVAPDPIAVEARIEALLGACRRLPNERPRDMFFRFWGDNGYEYPVVDRLSTFSVDVDTASYALARNYLVSGYLPEKHAVRTEEFLNYFKGDVRPPEKATFAIETELAPSLFGETRDALMLRVAIRGKEVSKAERTPVALTFVIDVSGSMKEQNRLELVKNALRLLVTQLDARDSVAVVTFSNDAQLVLPMTSAKNRLALEQALQPLAPQSGTNTEAGLRLGYEQAFAHLDSNVQNRVVLLTDGVANVGITDPAAMTERVSTQRRAGIYLNTIGVGMNNHNDTLLEQLADKGDGLCNYVDDAAEAKRALVDNFTGAFQPIARDVKVQVEFDPAQVQRYRLLGYENRAIADKDFRNDAVDAGEVGAGHQVVALYELVPGSALGDGPLATVRLHWKDPHGEGATEQAHESAHPVTTRSVAGSYAQTSAGYRRSVLVGQFAEFLRRSAHANGDSLDRLIEESRKLARELKDPEFDEFVALVAKSRDLIVARLAAADPCDTRLDELRRIECLRAELELLCREGEFAAVEARRGELERELRDCLRQRLMLRQR
ncbi:MAG: von Willebrand factor type A domain-containing protein [Planctomycetes bacterium]|nr:von Willebrand factor type A domain-containing protein [Planctomycetota bacterium]